MAGDRRRFVFALGVRQEHRQPVQEVEGDRVVRAARLIADVTPDRRTGRAATAVVCLTLLCFSGCRLTDVWFGARTRSSGRAVELAAKTSLCSCAVFENRTDQPVFIDSSLDEASTGDAVVPARSSLQQRFDWAGPKPGDF